RTCTDFFLARRTGKRWHYVIAAVSMDQLDRRSIRSRHPSIAPSEQRNHHRIEVDALFRQAIFEAPRAILILHARKNAFPDQLGKPRRQAMTRHAQVFLKIREAANAQKRVANDQERPAIADDRQCSRDGTLHLVYFSPTHKDSPGRLVSLDSILSSKIELSQYAAPADARNGRPVSSGEVSWLTNGRKRHASSVR